MGSSIVCFRCLAQREAERPSYATLLAPDDAASTPLDVGLERTNPELGRALQATARADSQGAPRDLVQRAEALLFARRGLAEVAERLGRWESLDSEARRGVADELEASWVRAGSPARPSTPIQPGMAGWRRPIREPSTAAALDPSVLVIVVAVAILLSVISAMLK
ncbi:MAG: hypothetical protein HYZ29_20180 [Myxococcales bacterium]|nr:hypothetical protein [Myxococcales bacterium]